MDAGGESCPAPCWMWAPSFGCQENWMPARRGSSRGSRQPTGRVCASATSALGSNRIQ